MTCAGMRLYFSQIPCLGGRSFPIKRMSPQRWLHRSYESSIVRFKRPTSIEYFQLSWICIALHLKYMH